MTKYGHAMTTEAESSSVNQGSQAMPNTTTNLTDGGMIPITGHKLTGQNYNQEDYLTGTAPEPKEDDAKYRTWKTENNMVMSWLLNSMTNETGENFMYYKTAKEIWDAVRDTYSNKDNASAIFELKGVLHDLRQDEKTVTEYFNLLVRYWQQLDVLDDVSWNCAADQKQYKEIQEKERVYKLLLGLNQNLDEVRGRILSTKPLPSVREAFSEVRREETRRKVMLGSTTTEGSALVARKGNTFTKPQGFRNNESQTNPRSGNRPWCDHCKIPGHTKEICWKIHGKPPGKQPYRPFGHAAAVESSPFSQKQIEELQRMLQTTIRTAIGEKGTAAMAQGLGLGEDDWQC